MNSRRPYQSASTRAITIAGIAVAVIALGVGGGYLGTTLTATTSNPAGTTPTTAEATTTEPASTATAAEATTKAPTALRKGTVSSSAAAPATGAGGLPTGWPNTPEGAVAAATSFLCWDSRWIEAAKHTDEVLEEFFTPAAREAARLALETVTEHPEILTKTKCQPALGAYAVVSDTERTTVLTWQPLLDTTTKELRWHCLGLTPLRWNGSRWLFDAAVPADVLCPSAQNPVRGPLSAENKAAILRSVEGYGTILRVDSWSRAEGAKNHVIQPEEALIKPWDLDWQEYADATR